MPLVPRPLPLQQPHHQQRPHHGRIAQHFGKPTAVGGGDDTVVVTGSIYLLGEVLARLQPDIGAAEGRLQDF